MANNPLVSIVVPSYNHAKFLHRRLQSIEEQCYQNIEIILLDDASEDESASILRNFADGQDNVTHIVLNDSNTGQPIEQWSRGLAMAKGEYVWFAESDDYCEPNFLSNLVNAIQSDQSVGIVYCKSYLTDQDDQVLGAFELNSSLYKENLWSQSFHVPGRRLVEEYFSVRNIIPNASAALFNRALMKKHIEKVKHLKILADWLLYIKMAMDSNVVYVNEPLNFCRTHNSGLTRSYSIAKHHRILSERFNILRYIIGLFPSAEEPIRALRLMLKSRHKFRRAERVRQTLKNLQLGGASIALFGFNDLAKFVLETNFGDVKPDCIIDRSKAGAHFNTIDIKSIEHLDVNRFSVIAIMSLEHAGAMRKELDSRGFRGRIVLV